MTQTTARVVLTLGVLLLSTGGAIAAVALGSKELALGILTFGGGLLVPVEKLESRMSGAK